MRTFVYKFLNSLLICCFIMYSVAAQSNFKNNFSFSAYGDIYYSYDFNNPSNHEKPNFIYNHKRHNEINANLLLIRANYQDEGLRANIGLMAGNYAQ